MDIVGPLPQSKSGNRFILTIVDYATRYPEAIALPSTEASRIAKELVTYFSRVECDHHTDEEKLIVSTIVEVQVIMCTL